MSEATQVAPSTEAVDRLLTTLENIQRRVQASGASAHNVALLYFNLKLAKESFGKKPSQYARALTNCMSSASEFIAGYRI